jgi:hypothetical protein
MVARIHHHVIIAVNAHVIDRSSDWLLLAGVEVLRSDVHDVRFPGDKIRHCPRRVPACSVTIGFENINSHVHNEVPNFPGSCFVNGLVGSVVFPAITPEQETRNAQRVAW